MGDTVWLDVLPSLVNFGSKLSSGTAEAAKNAGKQSGDAWATTFSGAAGDAGSSAAVAKLQSAAKTATKAVQDQTVAISKARAAQSDANAKVVEAEEKLRQARESGDPAKVEAAELRLQSARDRASAATSKYEQTEEALKAAKNEQKEVNQQLEDSEKDLGEETAQTTERAEKQAGAWDSVKGAVKTASVVAVAAFAALATGGKVLYDVGATFDDMTDTIRIGTGATGAALDGLVDTAKQVATSVPTDFETASTTVADLNTRLGLSGDTLKTVASQFIEAGNMMGSELNIQEVTGSLQAFKIEGEDTASAMDHLFRVSQATGMGMDELASAAKAQAPAMQELGFSFEDTTSMIGLLDRAGLNSKAVLAGMGKGLVQLAKDGEQPSEAFGRITDDIGKYVKAGDKAKALKLAAEVFGTKGATQFVDAISNGSLALDAFSESGLASSDTILGAAADTHDFAEAWEMFKNDVLVQIEPVASKVFGLIGDGMKWFRDEAVPAIKAFGSEVVERVQPGIESFGSYMTDSVVPALKDTVTWVKENKDWLLAVAVGVGTVVTAWGAYKVGMAAWSAATTAASAVQTAFNIVMNANPIMLIVTAVAALVAGLIYFFTQTETGKKVWESFTSSLTNAWQVCVDAITGAWDWTGQKLQAGWKWVSENVFDPVKRGAGWVGEKFVSLKETISGAWDKVQSGLKTGSDWISKWVITPFVGFTTSIGNAFVNAKDSINGAWDKVKSGLKAGWDWIDKYVLNPLTLGVQAIGTVFGSTKDIIKTAWDKIKEVAAKPVNFIIETVYGKGIKAAWDTIASKVGLNLKLPTIAPIKFADGGVLPGYTPGRDIHRFYSPTGGLLDLSGGEAIMRPEFTQAIGGKAGVARLNAAARAGTLQHSAFSWGGVWDAVTGGAKKAWNWTKDAAGNAWDWTKDAANAVSNFLKDPIGALAELIGKPVTAMLGKVAPGVVGDVVKAVPSKVVDSLGSWVKNALKGREDDGAGGVGGVGMGWKAQVDILKKQFPDIAITSTYRPGAVVAGYGTPSYHAAGRAVDMTPSMTIFDWLSKSYPNSRELLYSPAGSRQIISNGRRGDTTGVTRSNHFSHVHWAMADGGVLPKDLNFGTYDTGGVLPPGDTLVSNKTGLPELVLNPEQIASLGQPSGPVDLSDRSIEKLAAQIAEDLGLVGDTVREVRRAAASARTMERMS